MAAASIHQDRLKGRFAAVGCAAVAHAALLAPLALGALGLEFEPLKAEHEPTILIQLEPRPVATSRPVRPAHDRSSLERRPSLSPAPLSGPLNPDHPALALLGPPPAEVATTIEGPWRVRPGIGGSGWGDCPEAFSKPSAQSLCNERNRIRLAAAASRSSQVPTPVSAPPPAVDPTGAFARTAAANQAWRDYTRNDGPYPGLRSLLRDH